MRIFGIIVAVLGTGYMVICLILYFYQDSLVYYPSREILATPAATGLLFDSFKVATADSINIHGWYVPAEKSRGTVLFCHGNGGNISNTVESIEIFHRLDLNVCIFDYRGYGESGGTPSEDGTYRDAEAVWKYLVDERKTAPSEIILFGRSLGGAIAVWLAMQHLACALVLESTFTSIDDMASRQFPFLPARMISRYHYRSVERIRNIHCPVLIVHSPDDELIPYEFGRELFHAANQPKEFFELGHSHNEGFILTGQGYVDALDSFITKYARKKHE